MLTPKDAATIAASAADAVGHGKTLIERLAEADWDGVAVSVAVTVKRKVPVGPDGVPPITPVAVLSVKPAGRVPSVMDQWNNSSPPTAVTISGIAKPGSAAV
jgi:hypothetical protein